jgi:hypothetical protein
MPTVTTQERQKINHKLKKMGFGGLDDRNLFAQIATLYKTHDSFRGLLMSTKPDQRRTAYESIRPHLCFVAKPLEEYERETKDRAEREQWDVYDGTNYPKPFKVGEVESEEYRLQKTAERVITKSERENQAKGYLTFTCKRCTKAESFPGLTRVDAAIKARDVGWLFVPKTLCGDCAKLYQTIQ